MGTAAAAPLLSRRAPSFSQAPQAASLLRLAALAGGGEDLLMAPGDAWDIGYELLSPCKACVACCRPAAAAAGEEEEGAADVAT